MAHWCVTALVLCFVAVGRHWWHSGADWVRGVQEKKYAGQRTLDDLRSFVNKQLGAAPAAAAAGPAVRVVRCARVHAFVLIM